MKVAPQQLTAGEIRAVKTYLCDEATVHWSLISVYYKMLRDNAAYMSKQTFYRCARALGFTRKRRRKPRYSIGIRASKPFELLHVDVTLLSLPDNTRVYIQIITDNFSRAILSCKAALTWNALHTATHLREVCEHWKLYRKPCTLMCDNGSENQGALHLFLEEPHVQIQKLTAQLDTHLSNSMAEAANKRAKYYYLLRQPFRIFADVERYLPRMMGEENNRFHYALLGFTPNEVLAGALPDKKFFASKIKQAAEHRRVVNRVRKCGVC